MAHHFIKCHIEKKKKELMPLGCLCRLVNASLESRVTAITTASTSTSTSTSGTGPTIDHHTRRASNHGDGTTGLAMMMTGDDIADYLSPSAVPMAYTELLRTAVARLVACGDSSGASRHSQLGNNAGGDSEEREGVAGAWAAIRKLDLRALFW